MQFESSFSGPSRRLAPRSAGLSQLLAVTRSVTALARPASGSSHARWSEAGLARVSLLSLVAVAVVAAAFSRHAGAHHGDADRYDQEVITVTGVVVDVQMVSPHAHLVLDVTRDGTTVRWTAELGGPQQLIKQFGWTPNTITKGMRLTMIGRQLKSGAPYLNLTERANIVVADTGREIYRTENFGAPAPTGPRGTL